MDNKKKVTLVITSCGRPELLRRTIDSFNTFNTHPIEEVIIVEDSGIKGVIDDVIRDFPKYTYIIHEHNQGQIPSIVDAYAKVKTDYVFHCEDDWEFYRSGFIEESMAVLESDPKVIQLWLRERNDTNGHPIDSNGRLVTRHLRKWHGFSFNPGLKRMSDYIPYDQITKNKGKSDATAEMEVGEYYFKKGYYAMIAKQGYVRHIGEETRSKDVAISGIWSHDEAKVEHKHSPKLARELLKLLPKSSPVIDLGCGLGYYLNELQKSGFECYGFEGTPDINLISIFKGIQKADLTKPLKTKVKGSVICLEVGEHIHKSQMEALLDNIDKVCKGILVLSWAIPGQGGNGHLNEMSNVKVRQMMEDRGYKEDRVQTKRLRNIAGSDLWWFKNTMFVFRKN